ncbi:unnamed protein product [Linum tenue]|uniref:C2H2-type domain-containing protein n=1 Tax=Linum tenue TaxID=586396 RepID=A0AAV0I3N6_9ROSI|nr:unnamed protein product [Linum tenue]
MEPNQKKKFICKFCNKRYPCGKSLGGHIRIHQNSNYSTDDFDDEAAKLNMNNAKKDSSTDAAGYILRENPKKTRKFETDVNNPAAGLSLQDKICKECGKGFQSLKALCGHMACHSRNYNYDDQSDTSDKLKDFVMDDQSDTETSAPSKRRRSKRMMRYKNVGLYNSSSTNTSSPVVAAAPPSRNDSGSFSSLASDLEQEQEDVARCLMMLSKDSSLKGCLSYVGDSSDNNSVVLEAKSSCLTKMRMRVKNNNNNNNSSSCYEEDDDAGGDGDNSFLEMKIARKKKQHQQRQVVISSENDDAGGGGGDGGYDSANSDSDYFNYGPKKVVEPEVVSFHGSTARFARVEMRSGFEESNNDAKRKGSTKIAAVASGAMGAQQQRRSNIHYKRGRDENLYESGENNLETENVASSKKTIKSSNGGGGGGKNPQGKTSKFLSSAAAAAAKKVKTHECPFCSKVFRSGQALGGHKRSHFVGAADDATVVIKQQVGLIDLNLPAPVEEEQHHHQQQAQNGFVTW